ncbi:MAG: hypothetical protein WC612_03760 [Bdellovibrionales bacterium]|jgi:hypothetical protein
MENSTGLSAGNVATAITITGMLGATALFGAYFYYYLDNKAFFEKSRPAIQKAITGAAQEFCTPQGCPRKISVDKYGVTGDVLEAIIGPSLTNGRPGLFLSARLRNIKVIGRDSKLAEGNIEIPLPKNFKFAADRPPASGKALMQAESTPQ